MQLIVGSQSLPSGRIDHSDAVVGIINEGVLTGYPGGTVECNDWLGCRTQTLASRAELPAWLHESKATPTLGVVVALWGDGEAGVHWLADLQARFPRLKIVACTNLHGPWLLKNAWQTGLRALVDVDHIITDLPVALFGLAPGERFCSDTLQPAIRCHTPEARLFRQLGKSQRQALALIGEGCDDHDISGILSISSNAVGKLRRHLEGHFELKSRRELGVLARHLGLILINGANISRPWFDA